MRVLICGDRHWTDYRFIYLWVEELIRVHEEVHHILKDYPNGMEPLIIIEGEADGVDMMARVAAEELGIAVEKFPANWKKHGKAAGPRRNQQMLDEGKPDVIMAFHDDVENSKGTKDMIERAKKARSGLGIPCRVFTHKDGPPANANSD